MPLHFVQTCRIDHIRSEPYNKVWTLVTMVCPCRFMECSMCTTGAGDAGNGEAVNVWEQGMGYVENLFLSSAVNRKLL